MSAADQAHAIVEWVYGDPHGRAAEGVRRIAALTPTDEADQRQVFGAAAIVHRLLPPEAARG